MANAIIAINFASEAEALAGTAINKTVNPAVLTARLRPLSADTITFATAYVDARYAHLSGDSFTGLMAFNQGLSANDVTVNSLISARNASVNSLTAQTVNIVTSLTARGDVVFSNAGINLGGITLSATPQAFTVNRHLSAASRITTLSYSLCDTANGSGWLITTAEGGRSIDISRNGNSAIRILSGGQIGVLPGGTLSYGTSGQVLRSQGLSLPPTWGRAGGDVALLQERAAAGATPPTGSAATGGITRKIQFMVYQDVSNTVTSSNTVIPGGFVLTLADGIFTLQPGAYEIIATAPAYYCDQSKIALYKNTSEVVIVGTSAYSNNANYAIVESTVRGGFVVTSSTDTYQIKHWITVTSGGANGFGYPSNLGALAEVYAQIWLRKVS